MMLIEASDYSRAQHPNNNLDTGVTGDYVPPAPQLLPPPGEQSPEPSYYDPGESPYVHLTEANVSPPTNPDTIVSPDLSTETPGSLAARGVVYAMRSFGRNPLSRLQPRGETLGRDRVGEGLRRLDKLRLLAAHKDNEALGRPVESPLEMLTDARSAARARQHAKEQAAEVATSGEEVDASDLQRILVALRRL